MELFRVAVVDGVPAFEVTDVASDEVASRLRVLRYRKSKDAAMKTWMRMPDYIRMQCGPSAYLGNRIVSAQEN